MNREIKFRGRAINGDKQWVYGGILPMYRGAVHILPTFGSFVQVDPSTVGQFTGLYDAEGREVYEGDVLETNSEEVFQVKYHYGCFYGHSEKRDPIDNIAEKLEYLLHFYECCIAGTIHDPQPENDE